MSLVDHIQKTMVADIQMEGQQKEHNLVVAVAHIQLLVVGTVAAVNRMLVEVAEFHRLLVRRAAAVGHTWLVVAVAAGTFGLPGKTEVMLGLMKPFQTDLLVVLLAVLLAVLLVEHQMPMVVHSR